MLYSAYRPTPLGRILLAGDGDRLTGLWFEGQKYFAASAGEPMTEKSDLPLFRLAGSWLDEYFHGQNPAIADLPLAPRGSVFRRAVWDILREIPYGELTTYGAIAARLAVRTGRKSMSAQAVGGAVGHNPISIIIPCHRVVGTDGSLTGYAGGLDRKIRLLELEGAERTCLFVPKKGTALQAEENFRSYCCRKPEKSRF